MKKIAIYMSRFKIGGMENSLVNFINFSNLCRENKVTLYLAYDTTGAIYKKVPSNVEIRILYNKQLNFISKIIAGIKTFSNILLKLFKIQKYDIGICYSNHHRILSFFTRYTSKTKIIFIHSDLERYSSIEFKKINNKLLLSNFNYVFCVSNRIKGFLDNKIPVLKNKTKIIHNFINGEQIIKLSQEKIPEKINFNIPTFVCIANHIEKFKNINYILDSAKILNKKKLEFQILLIGSGKDTEMYERKIVEDCLEKKVFILKEKQNPYPYLRQSISLLLTSRYEGYGMVLDEARTLGTFILSTDCGSAKQIIQEGYGMLIEGNLDVIMEKIIKTQNLNVPKFYYKKFNDKINNSLEKLLRTNNV